MKFTARMRDNGSMAMRFASEKAMAFYTSTDPLAVYEYEDADGNTLYAYDGCFGEVEGLTFEELQRSFEELYDEIMEDEEDE